MKSRCHASAKRSRARCFKGQGNARGNTMTERTVLAGKNKLTSATLLSDQRGAVAFETLIVWLCLMMGVLLPLADFAIAGFLFLSARGALRNFGQYLQYAPHKPPDVTTWNATGGWTSTLPTTVAGYPISNLRVVCGDANLDCSPSNTVSPKYYSYA